MTRVPIEVLLRWGPATRPPPRDAMTTTNAKREPILRVVPRPGDINSNGHIFGGWVLSQMDIAAGIVAAREADGPVATVAVDAMKFLAPILLQIGRAHV